MKKFLPALLAIFLLAACTPTSSETNEAAENQPVDVFERNLECQKLKDELVETWEDDTRWVEGVFYSPKTNSCLYVLRGYYDLGESTLIEGILKDAFTDQVIEQFSNYVPSFLETAEDFDKATTSSIEIDIFDEKIKEYQN